MGRTLTPETRSRPTVERQITPSDIRKLSIFPSLWSEESSIFAIKVAASVHVVYGVTDTHSAADENGGEAIWAASPRESGGS